MAWIIRDESGDEDGLAVAFFLEPTLGISGPVLPSVPIFVHRYFHQPHTRLQVWKVEDLGDGLRVVEQRFGHP